MKKYLWIVFGCLLLVGCGNSSDDVVKKLSKKVETDSYHLSGELAIQNNEDTYLYDVDVSYAKENNFRVSLKNKTNDHEQIILRNEEGVYV